MWQNMLWLKDPEDLHQNQLWDEQNHSPRTTQIGFRGFRTMHIRSPSKEGLPIVRILKPLKPILVVLGGVPVVLELLLM